MAKYKMTLFARFFIFLIIAIPIAYIAAAYINGQNGIQQFLSLFQSQETKTEEVKSTKSSTDANDTHQDLLQQKSDSVQLLKEQLEACRNK